VDMKLLRAILAEEVGKTSQKDADDVAHGTETWRLTVALDAMRRAYEMGRDDMTRAAAMMADMVECDFGCGGADRIAKSFRELLK
jgi:hypothetical protein